MTLQELRKYKADWKRKRYAADPDFRRRALESQQRAFKRNPEPARARWRRKLSTPEGRLKNALRCRLRHALHGNIKVGRTLALLGMPLEEFRIYIQGQFKPGMTWENYGPVWHIDHIRPCASFDLSDPDKQRECFYWENLQPMFAIENMQKGGHYHS